MAEPGLSFRELGVIDKAIAKDGSFALRIEAINRFNNSRRVLVWNDQILIDSVQRRPRDKVIDGNADLDSLSESYIFYSWGQGLRWGVRLESMRVIKIRREAPYADI